MASVFMHAWSEVEHDLIYKPFSGELSIDEHAILDQINGLVLTGEVALENLQRAVNSRVREAKNKFKSHYEVASYLYDVFRPVYGNTIDEPVMGRVDILERFLQHANLNSPDSLHPFLQDLTLDFDGKPVSEQLVDRVLGTDSSMYEHYLKAQQEVNRVNPYRSSEEELMQSSGKKSTILITFIRSFNTFASAVSQVYQDIYVDTSARPTITFLQVRNLFSKLGLEADLRRYEQLRQIRNLFIHENERVDDVRLMIGLDELMSALTHLKEKLSGRNQEIIEEALKQIDKNMELLAKDG